MFNGKDTLKIDNHGWRSGTYVSLPLIPSLSNFWAVLKLHGEVK